MDPNFTLLTMKRKRRRRLTLHKMDKILLLLVIGIFVLQQLHVPLKTTTFILIGNTGWLSIRYRILVSLLEL